MTVIWPHVAGFREDRLSEMTTRLLDRLGRWLRRHHNVQLRAVWTRERGHEKGHHLHLLANIPADLAPAVRVYLARSFGIAAGGLKFSHGKYGMKVPSMQMGALRYACKSLDHYAFVYRGFTTCNVAEMLGIRHAGTDGPIQVKRAGTTENLGRKARNAAGWNEARYIEEVSELLNPQPRRKAEA
jgi:hypothetical protein